MKNKLKNLFLTLIMFAFVPFTAFLTSCGATPSGKVTGVKFESLKYDSETGYAIFEIDKDVTTDLKYKVFPSSSSGYKTYFDPVTGGTDVNHSRYTFQDGKITIHSKDFEQVVYKVRVGEYSDYCIIVLKNYPEKIEPNESEIIVNSFETRAINVKANFVIGGVSSERNITENDYDFLVESSDITIINIPNKNRLKFCSVRNGSASAKVTVTILNKQGEKTDLSFEINVKVIQNANDSFINISGSDKLVSKTSNQVNIDYSSLADNAGLKVIDFDILIINSSNFLIETDCGYSIQLSSKKFASLSEDGKSILLNGSVENDYVLKAKICTDLIMKDGSLFTIDIEMTIKK